MFVIAIVPVVASLARGLWLSLGAGLVYAAARLAIGGKGRALRAILILIPTMLAVVYLSPLKALVEDRFATPHSNERRVGLYEEAIRNVQESPPPRLRFSAPIGGEFQCPVGGNPRPTLAGPLFHGIPGMLLFAWWFLYQLWRMRGVSAP